MDINIKQVLISTLITMVAIYLIKWITAQVNIPVISDIAKEV